jgi:hypothetical protein
MRLVDQELGKWWPLAGARGEELRRRQAGGDQRAQHGSGRGADDDVGLAGLPAGDLDERGQGAGQPGSAEDSAGPQQEAGPRGSHDNDDIKQRDINSGLRMGAHTWRPV